MRLNKLTTEEVAPAPTDAPPAAIEAVPDEYEYELEPEAPKAPEVQTDLVYPKETRTALRIDDIVDPSYTPATNAEGLEEVGGIDGWWDRPAHWGPSKNYVGFGPTEKITDPAVLEALTKQAVVEALAVSAQLKEVKGKAKKARGLMLEYGNEDVASMVNTEVVVGEGGEATLKSEDVEGIQNLMHRTAETQEAEVEGPYRPSPEEARGMLKAWGSGWKAAQLKDPFVRFYTLKRIQQLTGHIVPDGKLVGMKSIGDLIAQVVKPPKPKKLVEEIQARGDLLELPNVHVFPRRITPVDKENQVGRWKIIEKELQRRGLPVLGTGGYRKAVEKSWIKGGV